MIPDKGKYSAMMRQIDKVIEERERQDAKWGEQNHPDLYWLGILGEEVGELSRALIEGWDKNRDMELVQVAAVAVAWLEAIARREVKE